MFTAGQGEEVPVIAGQTPARIEVLLCWAENHPGPRSSGEAFIPACDLYELQPALDLPGFLSAADLALLRRLLGENSDESTAPDADPLLCTQGPAARIGGTLVGDLTRSARRLTLSPRHSAEDQLIPDPWS